MSFNAIHENKILAKISKFTVYYTCYKKFSTFIMLNISHVLHSSLIIILFNWQHSSVKNCGLSGSTVFSKKINPASAGQGIKQYVNIFVYFLHKNILFCMFCLFGLALNVSVNSYCHVGMVSSPNNIIFLGKLD